MPLGIPRSPQHGRHTQPAGTSRRRRVAFIAAPAATVLAVGLGVLSSGFSSPGARPASDAIGAAGAAAASTTVPPAAPASAAPGSQRPAAAAAAPADARTLSTSRSVDRVPLVDHRVPKASGKRWTTATLALRTEPRQRARTAGVMGAVKQVPVTGRHLGAYTEVIVGRTSTRWVTSAYLAAKKPQPRPVAAAPATPATPAAPAGLSDQPCPDGSAIESALQPQSVKVYRAVCAAFPELTTYGGQDGHGEHVNGEAIDFMVPSSSVGERVKDFVYAHHSELGLFDIIWSQHIWTIERSGEGFRSMPDRGSATANHYDHVHIKIN